MSRLQFGATVLTTGHERIRILDELGEGGQGVVYRVDYNKGSYALKWYPRSMGIDEETFYYNMAQNVKKGSPAPTFLWPIALTQKDGRGRFGYVMGLRPPEYKEFSRFLLNRERFGSFNALIRAAVLISASFRHLHLKGFSYQDLNDGNFFVHPETGGVLICDNDNVAPDDASLGIKGKPRYMAPEVVLGRCEPDTYTDRFSLAVMLFLLLCRNHPLEGSADNGDEIPEINERRLFAENPVFIFDTQYTDNRPNPAVHVNALRLWPLYPAYIQELFMRSFCRGSMLCPLEERQHRRVTEKEWLRAFFRLRDSLAVCPHCQSETFHNGSADERCMNCGSPLPMPAVLAAGKHRIVLYPGKKVYPCHLDSAAVSLDAVDSPVGEVVRKDSDASVWGIRNTGRGTVWKKRSPHGKQGECPFGDVVPIARGMEICFTPDSAAWHIV